MERGYREVPHIADVALEVWGRNLPELFEQAAEGLFSLAVTVEPGASVSAERQVDLSATDLETLLVGWLNELLLLYDECGEGFVDFEVTLPAPGELSAKVRATEDCTGLRAIKAATFHNLAIRQEPGGYRAVVVFDV